MHSFVLFACEANNGYVSVSTNEIGIENIVVVGNDFHITTTNVNNNFSATVKIEPLNDWQIRSPIQSYFRLSVGDCGDYTVESIAERGAEIEVESGSIYLYKIDVEIDSVGETLEEIEGAYLPCEYVDIETNSFSNVRIRCVPVRENEEVYIELNGGSLFECVDNTYVVARNSYLTSELENKRFVLFGENVSSIERDKYIRVWHSVNNCNDVANFTIFNFDFSVSSILDTDYLIDNHPCNLIPECNPYSTKILERITFSAHPNTDDVIINKMGTNVDFQMVNNYSKWYIPVIYWYGTEDRCCYTCRNSYIFNAQFDSINIKQKEYEVEFLDEIAETTYLTRDGVDLVDFKNIVYMPDYDLYRAEVVFKKVIIDIFFNGLPVSNQYAEETEREEMFHSKQILGIVPTSQGGQGDCFSESGLRFFQALDKQDLVMYF